MATGILTGVRYIPEPPPSPNDPDFQSKLVAYLKREYEKIAEALRGASVFTFDEQFVAIDKPQEGDTLLADGTSWNPGAGQGVYTYYNGAYHKLG